MLPPHSARRRASCPPARRLTHELGVCGAGRAPLPSAGPSAGARRRGGAREAGRARWRRGAPGACVASSPLLLVRRSPGIGGRRDVRTVTSLTVVWRPLHLHRVVPFLRLATGTGVPVCAAPGCAACTAGLHDTLSCAGGRRGGGASGRRRGSPACGSARCCCRCAAALGLGGGHSDRGWAGPGRGARAVCRAACGTGCASSGGGGGGVGGGGGRG